MALSGVATAQQTTAPPSAVQREGQSGTQNEQPADREGLQQPQVEASNSPAPGQRAPKSKPESELTEGLLDLLNEPQQSAAAGRQPSETGSASKPELGPSDVGLEGQDLRDNSMNPLESVRQSMLIAAGYLDRGITNVETQRLQGDIVQRLDELIDEIDQSRAEGQQQPQPRDQAAQPQPQSQSQSQSQSRVTQTESQGGEQQSDPPQRPKSDNAGSQNLPGSVIGQIGQDNPGLSGSAAEGNVQMSDPVQLQQNVWGQLPERVRKQMQSRMVERFLPSYREQIEAYFQALLESR